jgi:hypothetical protein
VPVRELEFSGGSVAESIRLRPSIRPRARPALRSGLGENQADAKESLDTSPARNLIIGSRLERIGNSAGPGRGSIAAASMSTRETRFPPCAPSLCSRASAHRDPIAESGQVFDFELTDEEMGRLDELDRTGGTDRVLEQRWW